MNITVSSTVVYDNASLLSNKFDGPFCEGSDGGKRVYAQRCWQVGGVTNHQAFMHFFPFATEYLTHVVCHALCARAI
jgi:hypothetical protein